MSNHLSFALLSGFALAISSPAAAAQSDAPAAAESAPVNAKAGDILFDANGKSVASVYSVGSRGSVSLLLKGKIVSVPGSSLSRVNHRLVTSLGKSEIGASR
ncbi:hypothetical protein ACFSCW_15680 [Sphingomonas tabacisoli]|uniref:Uncharacterized protein n=1 Tax=Sphingomonas tabacisoli TaxID=2249466 RepID=A0ABW4I6V7_9SPHN